MALIYDPPPVVLPLRQGEILRDVWEHRQIHAGPSEEDDAVVDVQSVYHPLVVVMTADCDLEQDYKKRETAEAGEEYPAMIRQVLLCDAFDNVLEMGLPGSDVKRRSMRNQDIRYHYFGQREDAQYKEMPEQVWLDFKKTFGLPVEALLAGIAAGDVARVALVAPPYVYDLIQRFFSFHSRIGLPD